MRETDVIKKNLERLQAVSVYLDAVKASQLLEAELSLKGATPKSACDFFIKAFSKSPLCAEFLHISANVFKKVPPPRARLGQCKVACTKNPLLLRSVKELCSFCDAAHITDAPDFRTCCDLVAGGSADFCILPLASSREGYYTTFTKLLKTYDLRIVRSVTVSKNDSDEELNVALISKELSISSESQYISFSFPDSEKPMLSKLICAMDSEGIVPVSISSAPLEYNSEKFEHIVTAALCGFCPFAFIAFLEAAVPGHTVLGVY